MKHKLLLALKKALGLTICLVFLTVYGLLRTQTPQPGFFTPTVDGEKLWGLIQEFRKTNGLPLYQEHPVLCKIADLRLEEVKADWSHNGFYEKVEYCGDKPCQLGENLARGFGKEIDVLNAWLKSAPHSANLRADFPFSCLRTDGRIIVHIFGDHLASEIP